MAGVTPGVAGTRDVDDIVRTDRLSKSYGRHPALADVSLTVRRGEVFGYLGPNGAGKTTTIRLLLGLIRPSAGTAQVFGLDVWSRSTEVHRRVGYVAGEVAFWDRLTGHDLLGYLAHLRGGHDLSYAEALAARLDVDLTRAVRTLSKGNRQKVAIIQALMSRPDLLMLDEPTSGLDPLAQQQVHELLREHAAGGGTVLLSSHLLDEVQRIADRVGIIRSGALVAVERLDELRAKSLHHVVVRFADPVTAGAFDRVPDVHDLVVSDHTLSCAVPQPSLDPLLKVIAGHRIEDLSCEEASLEDTFLAYYGNGGRDAG